MHPVAVAPTVMDATTYLKLYIEYNYIGHHSLEAKLVNYLETGDNINCVESWVSTLRSTIVTMESLRRCNDY